jgi:putative MATE family efflux protein
MAVLEASEKTTTYPHENASKVVWLLAWPAVALNSLAVINNLLDTGFVGRLAPEAITAQGASIAVVFLLFQIAMALGTSATAIVSRSFGAKELNEARFANLQCLSLSIAIGMGLALVCMGMGVLMPHVLIPAGNVKAMHFMTQYVIAYAFSLPAQHIIQVFAGSLRGVGDTKSPMIISGLQILLHMTFNFFLIFGTRHIGGLTIPGAGFGLMGAGMAFSLSSWVAALVYIAYGKRTLFGSLWKFPAPTRQWSERILKIAFPAAIMGIVRTLAMGVFIFVLRFVPDASAAVGAVRGGFTIESIMFMPGFGLSMAAAALVGQSLGMGRPDRAEKLGWTAAHYSGLVVLCISVPIFIFAPNIATLLVPVDPQIAKEMAAMMRFLCATEFLFGYSMVMSGALQGAGDTVRPMWVTIISLWGMRIPLALILALVVGMGASGAWLAMAITQGIAGLMGMWLFKQGRWKTVKV